MCLRYIIDKVDYILFLSKFQLLVASVVDQERVNGYTKYSC